MKRRQDIITKCLLKYLGGLALGFILIDNAIGWPILIRILLQLQSVSWRMLEFIWKVLGQIRRPDVARVSLIHQLVIKSWRGWLPRVMLCLLNYWLGLFDIVIQFHACQGWNLRLLLVSTCMSNFWDQNPCCLDLILYLLLLLLFLRWYNNCRNALRLGSTGIEQWFARSLGANRCGLFFHLFY